MVIDDFDVDVDVENADFGVWKSRFSANGTWS